jgi:CRP/FNR family transcriptional regulator, anaerobic regulatory protein
MRVRLALRPRVAKPRTGQPALVVAGHRAQASAVACGGCRLSSQCLPFSLDGRGVEILERLPQPTPLLEKGAVLHHRGSPFENLYVVQFGALKGVNAEQNGQECVARFYLPGEIVGLHAIDQGRFNLSVVALETTALCRIPYATFQTQAAQNPSLTHWLLRRISAEIRKEREIRLILASGNAAQMLAHALIDLGERFARGGLSATRLRLPMTRCELGSHLGLTPETMSRLFRRLTRQRLVTADRREVELLDTERLQALATGRIARRSSESNGVMGHGVMGNGVMELSVPPPPLLCAANRT